MSAIVRKMWYFIVYLGICQMRLNLALFKSCNECNIFIFNGWTLDPLMHSNGFLLLFFVSGVSAKAASSDDKKGNFAQFVIFT